MSDPDTEGADPADILALSGFTAESVEAAILAGNDWSLLKHPEISPEADDG